LQPYRLVSIAWPSEPANTSSLFYPPSNLE
jgi:hypothetical protein